MAADVDQWMALARPSALLAEESGMGNVVYVPADAAVTERDDRPASFPFDIDEYAEGRARLLLGGYGTDCNGVNPAEMAAGSAGDPFSPDPEDWVLLAQAKVSRPGGGAGIFWTMQRDDLVGQRFERAQVLVDWNP